ncbi:MAG: hypothetical protein WA138_01505 [Parvibaculum sp.]
MSRWSRLFSVLIFVALAACGRDSNDVVRSFFDDIAHGDTREAATYFSPLLHAKFTDDKIYGAIDDWSREIASHGGLRDISLSGGVILYNQLALYDVTLRYRDTKTKQIKVTVVRTEGVWYITTAL